MSGKIALVTGANKGLGKGVVELLAEEGCDVILTSRNKEKGENAAAELNSIYHRVFFCQLDIDSLESIKEAVQYCRKKFGRLDILINNAAINYDEWNMAVNADLDECRRTIETNLFGQWMMVQEFLPLLKESKSGRIVNVSSGSGSLSDFEPGAPAYSISKAGLNMLTIKLAHELKPYGILVNSVCPGWVRTDMGGNFAPRNIRKGAESIIWPAIQEKKAPTGGFFRDGQRISW